ncbi:MAG: hypothetical protein N3F67_05395 [Acidilobaceae archaeon]|nr:hypothetical protein [Acidilobaceae archaeon]
MQVDLSPEAEERLRRIAEELGSSPEALAKALLETLASYPKEAVQMAKELKVSQEKRAESFSEELIFYGFEAWRALRKLLKSLGAEGSFELVGMELDPQEPSLELELLALEGSPFRADGLVVSWSTEGVMVSAIYYVEAEPPQREIAYEWSYLPDEKAVQIDVFAKKLSEAPKLGEIDEEARRLGV